MMTDKETDILLGDAELSILLTDVEKKYGYDFNNYSKASLKRRVSRLLMKDRISSFVELRFKLMEDEMYFNHFLEEITVNVTEMFRDPLFFKSLRENVFPQLSTYPLIRIWHAGCSSGEEVFSMAIMLEEEGLLDRSLLYATDINQLVLENAQRGEFPIEYMKVYTENYIKAGGKKEFSSYYTAKYGKALFNDNLKKRMVFSTHNLGADQSFNEFNLVVCRNVLIYFNRDLQDKVIGLFNDSLPNLGYLALGSKESLSFSNYNMNFKTIDKKHRIWQKVK
jgi:chemotaxis protein methyltransferase CheR